MQNERFIVRGMSCSHCVHTIGAALAKIGANAEVDLAAGAVTVRYDESKVSRELVVAAIEALGYDILR